MMSVVVVPRDKIEEVLDAAEVKIAYEEKRVFTIEQYRKCKKRRDRTT